jgi:hypothetical protein
LAIAKFKLLGLTPAESNIMADLIENFKENIVLHPTTIA